MLSAVKRSTANTLARVSSSQRSESRLPHQSHRPGSPNPNPNPYPYPGSPRSLSIANRHEHDRDTNQEMRRLPALRDRSLVLSPRSEYRRRTKLIRSFSQERVRDKRKHKVNEAQMDHGRLWNELSKMDFVPRAGNGDQSSKSETEIEINELQRSSQIFIVLHPRGKRKSMWDLFVSMCIVYSCLIVPFQLSFQAASTGGSFWLDTCVDIIFGLDIVLTFRTVVIEADGDITDHMGRVACRYLKGWFIIDLLATFPIEAVAGAILSLSSSNSSSSSALASAKLLRILRLVRLVRLSRLVKLRAAIERFQDEMLIHPSVMNMIKIALQLVIIGHYLACVWYGLAQLAKGLDPEAFTWLDRWNLQDASTTHKYIASLYFSFTTMATVGYGDIVPQTNVERGFLILAELIGATVFGYLVGNVTNLIEEFDLRSAQFRNKMDRIKEYASERALPVKVARRMAHQYKYFYEQTTVYDVDDYVDELPKSCKIAFCLTLHKLTIEAFTFLKNSNPFFVVEFVSLMKPFFMYSGEALVYEGEVCKAMFFVKEGSVQLLCKEAPSTKPPTHIEDASGGMLEIEVPEIVNHVKYEQIEGSDFTDGDSSEDIMNLKVLEEDSFFGVESILLNAPYPYTAVTITHCDLFFVSRTDVTQILDRWGDIRDHLLAHTKKFMEAIELKRMSSKEKETKESDASMTEDQTRLTQISAPYSTSAIHLYFKAKPTSNPDLDVEDVNIAPEVLWATKRIIHPDSVYKAVWDACMCVLIIYSVITVTFRLGFNQYPSYAAGVADLVIDGLFFVDIILTFRSAFTNRMGNLVTNALGIRLRYLRSWFVIDFVSTVPWDTILVLVISSNSQLLKSTKLIRAIRLARLAKVARLLKLSRFFESYEDYIVVNPSLLRLFRLLVVITFLAHLNACLYFAVSISATSTSKWTHEYCVQASLTNDELVCLNDWDVASQYLATLYWAFTTMTTVGYGDITPSKTSIPEMLVGLISILVASMLFAYIIGAVVSIILNLDPSAKARKQRLGYLQDLMNDMCLPKSVSMSIRKHMQFQMQVNSALDQMQILALLPPHLATAILLYVNRVNIPRLPLLCTLEFDFPGSMSIILPLLTPAHYTKGDMIMSAKLPVCEVYFFLWGTAAVLSVSDNSLQFKVETSDCIGQHTMFVEDNSHFVLLNEVQASAACRTLNLTKSQLTELQYAYPEVEARILDALAKLIQVQEHGSIEDWIKYVHLDSDSSRSSDTIQVIPTVHN